MNNDDEQPARPGEVPVYLRAGDQPEHEIGRVASVMELPLFLREVADMFELQQQEAAREASEP